MSWLLPLLLWIAGAPAGAVRAEQGDREAADAAAPRSRSGDRRPESAPPAVPRRRPPRTLRDRKPNLELPPDEAGPQQPVPPGWVRLERDRVVGARVRERLTPPTSVFIPILQESGVVCVRFDLLMRKKTGMAMRRIPPRAPGVITEEYGLGMDDTGLSLTGPTKTYRRGLSLLAGCIGAYSFVGMSDEAVELIWDLRRDVVAFHPDDTELWFMSREVCEQRATPDNASSFCQ